MGSYGGDYGGGGRSGYSNGYDDNTRGYPGAPSRSRDYSSSYSTGYDIHGLVKKTPLALPFVPPVDVRATAQSYA